MPKGDPFTALCQQAASLGRRVVADLHLHTTASDGDYTPSQVAAYAVRAKLDAIAITDHDTLAGVAEAARVGGVRVIPGVELTAEWSGHEVHVLGYFAGPPPAFPFGSRLTELCVRRRERFRDFVRLIREGGHSLDEGRVAAVEAATESLGRRHVANLLMRCGLAQTYGQAWGRFVAPLGKRVIPKLRLPFAEATEWVRACGGVSVLAHPSADLSESDFAAMKEAGLDGIEAAFPAAGVGRTSTLREIARRLGLRTSGGSDCHGAGREVGSCGVGAEELRALVGEGVPAARTGGGGDWA